MITKIQILTTGGTIEGLDYDDENKASLNVSVSIAELLENISTRNSYIIQNVFSKDSRFISDDDRNNITEIIRNSPNQKILITHGTLTMVETAVFLGKQSLDKIVILTGAFILGTKPDTDAQDNLEFALSQFDQLTNGVYIAMHQSVFLWDNVKKNTISNQFEKLN